MNEPSLDPHLVATLAGLRPALQAMRDPWWIIGSAGLALLGAFDGRPQDIDLLTSAHDAEALTDSWHAQVQADRHPADGMQFRSVYARFVHLPLPVEVMGGLEVRRNGSWETLTVRESEVAVLDGFEVRVPALAEQIRILRLFGRDKDLAKAAQAEAHARTATFG